MPQANINASFEIYEDEPDPEQVPVAETPTKTEKLADEFENDPDYQVKTSEL